MLAAGFLLLASCGEKKERTVHYNAFSHNDYMRERPLFDALSHGFNCVEVDVHLINGKLYVAHDYPEELSKVKTFDELYLQPLAEEVAKNGGSVYPHSNQPFLLMIDFKAKGDSCYTTLKPMLEQHRSLFCSVANGEYTPGPILLFFSGSRPLATLPQENTRLAFLDGQLADLGQNIPTSLMPVVSDHFAAFFQWNGEGKMPEDELTTLREMVKHAHAEEKKLRFWGGPDTQAYQQMQLEEGVDIIGTDDLAALCKLLENEN